MIDKFIGFSGPYSPFALNPNKAYPSIQACGLNPVEDLVYNGKTKTSALLIEGEADEYDLYPKTGNSHLEYLKRILQKSNIYAVGYWVEGDYDGCS